VPIDVYGSLATPGCKFLRIDNRFNGRNFHELHHLYQLIVEDSGEKKPNLLLTISGGAKYFTLKERLYKAVVRGIIDSVSKAGN
jgi:hypothetical protein